jgi:hypothetical protein
MLRCFQSEYFVGDLKKFLLASHHVMEGQYHSFCWSGVYHGSDWKLKYTTHILMSWGTLITLRNKVGEDIMS